MPRKVTTRLLAQLSHVTPSPKRARQAFRRRSLVALTTAAKGKPATAIPVLERSCAKRLSLPEEFKP